MQNKLNQNRSTELTQNDNKLFINCRFVWTLLCIGHLKQGNFARSASCVSLMVLWFVFFLRIFIHRFAFTTWTGDRWQIFKISVNFQPGKKYSIYSQFRKTPLIFRMKLLFLAKISNGDWIDKIKLCSLNVVWSKL